jgi:hypothetical protein
MNSRATNSTCTSSGTKSISGERADLIEVLNLDPGAKSEREVVKPALIQDVRDRIRDAGESLWSAVLLIPVDRVPKDVSVAESASRLLQAAATSARQRRAGAIDAPSLRSFSRQPGEGGPPVFR